MGAANGSERFALRKYDDAFLVRQNRQLIIAERGVSAKGTTPTTSTNTQKRPFRGVFLRVGGGG